MVASGDISINLENQKAFLIQNFVDLSHNKIAK